MINHRQEEINKWSLKTVDEDGLIDLLEKGQGIKRVASAQNEREKGETVEEEKPAKAIKKQKK